MAVPDTGVSGSRSCMFPDVPDDAWEAWRHYMNPRGNLRMNLVTPDLTLVPAPGHTPAHACVAIVSDGEKAMIVGDLAHHPVQLTETAWEMAFDMDKRLASETRERIAQRMEQDGGLTIGGHFP